MTEANDPQALQHRDAAQRSQDDSTADHLAQSYRLGPPQNRARRRDRLVGRLPVGAYLWLPSFCRQLPGRPLFQHGQASCREAARGPRQELAVMKRFS